MVDTRNVMLLLLPVHVQDGAPKQQFGIVCTAPCSSVDGVSSFAVLTTYIQGTGTDMVKGKNP